MFFKFLKTTRIVVQQKKKTKPKKHTEGTKKSPDGIFLKLLLQRTPNTTGAQRGQHLAWTGFCGLMAAGEALLSLCMLCFSCFHGHFAPQQRKERPFEREENIVLKPQELA